MTAMPRLAFTGANCFTIIAVTIVVHSLGIDPAHAAKPAAGCTQVATANQLSNIRQNLAGSYCLANDIDLGSIGNFKPIGDETHPFTGRLDGKGHVIRNLTINRSVSLVGLFGLLNGALITDVVLADVNVTGATAGTGAGGLAGDAAAASTIKRVSVSGHVTATDSNFSGFAGGVLGGLSNDSTIEDTSSSASVTGGFHVAAGGLIGISSGTVQRCHASGNVTGDGESHLGGLIGEVTSGLVRRSYATGAVAGGGDAQTGLGGLIGLVGGSAPAIQQSFATGPVTAIGQFNFSGGLIGVINTGSLKQAYATGPVSAGSSGQAGGLIGHAGSVTIDQTYSAGPVSGGAGTTVGGLVATTSGSPTVTNSYWDTHTSGQSASAAGAGLSTSQLRAVLPAGFASAWGITATFSYPFLDSPSIDFVSPLATRVISNEIFTFVPVGQRDDTQYLTKPLHADADQASLAAVYTMIARAIGITDGVNNLKDVKIDRYFWHDNTQTATFSGPVTNHASLGGFTILPAAVPLNDNNVVGKLKGNRVVILRGSFTKPGGLVGRHWMLATLFTTGAGGATQAVFADDSWAGQQVTIDPQSKTVTSPANFPLANFKVDGYQTVTFN